MKFSKLLFVFAICFILLSCNDDDDNTQNSNIITPNITLDLNGVLSRPAGADITDLINFGQPNGVSAGDYLVELNVGTRLRLEQPSGLAAGQSLLYSRIFFFEENPSDPGVFDVQVDTLDVYDVWLDRLRAAPGDPEAAVNPNDFGRSISEFFELIAIDAPDSDDIDYKYEIEIALRLPNGSISDYYYIDPKIRIKSLN
ncbi:MAG: hypothetical protein ED556_08010 [Winogradskyella sp.]|uniref:hypothetical protein n=1 Tax=Winogradskyella sp. TaxID=1883156 RepID=UPI000F40215B|nr:hypothetical protein [Winogradskyella sp.]RNC86233.1 MAG: hypothetical protein ED556_08010 [Winogradskyella sp.]